MSNILQTESLTKSRDFLGEAFKILWEHKGVFFAFAIGPILFFMGLTYIEEASHFQINGSGGTLFINILFDIAWLRYILHAGPTKSLALHWSVGKSYLKFSLYYFLIFCSYIASIFLLYYLCQLPMEDFTLILDPQFTINIFMFVLGVCILSYFLLPIFLALSASAINQPIKILQVVRQASPYRTSLFLSCVMLFLITAPLFIFLVFAMNLNPSIPLMVGSFVINVWAFFSVGLFFNLFSLYYRKYLENSHGVNG